MAYEQIVDFEFQFGSDGGTTLWPHIQVNTLRQEKDLIFPICNIPYFRGSENGTIKMHTVIESIPLLVDCYLVVRDGIIRPL